MILTETETTVDFPDDPRKWDGWSNYQAENPYQRLCLDQAANPSDEEIQQHCAALLRWWQKKLPLKHQTSNPLAQLLGRGFDEAPRELVQARTRLLDPVQRRQVDEDLAAVAREQVLADFARYVGFCIGGGVLTQESEATLTDYGLRAGLPAEQIAGCIEEHMKRKNAHRAAPPAPVVRPAPPAAPVAVSPRADAERQFIRVLVLAELNMWSATDSVRQIFAAIGYNLGIDADRTDALVEDFLEEAELELAKRGGPAAEHRPERGSRKVSAPLPAARPARPAVLAAAVKTDASKAPASFLNPAGGTMILIPAGQFVMGSEASDAAPNEQPLTQVKLSAFYMSRHPITNAQYELFDRAHLQKRMTGAAGHYPVVYVTSHDAAKYCEWLGRNDGKKYRLPTEAEWEYAARGTDARKYPWGDTEGRGDLGNFADASTSFAWRDQRIRDGYSETSPIGAFPRGASFFGIEDMAGNVWEWCLDFFAPLPGWLKLNPRGGGTGNARVHRGGSWKSRFSNLRASARASNHPTYASNDVGFRVVCEC